MKLIVISDTHIPHSQPDFPVSFYEIIESADMVVHAGDFVSLKAYKDLEARSNLKAVKGNMDADLAQILPADLIFEVDGLKIGVMHGWGSPQGTVKNVRQHFEKSNCELIIFGHSHSPFNEIVDGVRMFNPGSLLDKRFSSHHTYGEIELEGGRIKSLEIKKLCTSRV